MEIDKRTANRRLTLQEWIASGANPDLDIAAMVENIGEMLDMFRAECASRLEPLVHQALERASRLSFEDKQIAATQLNEYLHVLGLALTTVDQPYPSTIDVTRSMLEPKGAFALRSGWPDTPPGYWTQRAPDNNLRTINVGLDWGAEARDPMMRVPEEKRSWRKSRLLPQGTKSQSR